MFVVIVVVDVGSRDVVGVGAVLVIETHEMPK